MLAQNILKVMCTECSYTFLEFTVKIGSCGFQNFTVKNNAATS